MSYSEPRNWLVGYDIANHRRLGRVHRFLKRHAIPVQYSVFVLRGDQRALDRVYAEIAQIINPKEDDVRAYYLAERCEVTVLGSQHLPPGVLLPVKGLSGLLHELTDATRQARVIESLEQEEKVGNDG